MKKGKRSGKRFYANKTDANKNTMLGTLRERERKFGHNGRK